jgi:uncharacterized protein YndB with AHSA1/START domain
MTYELRLDRVFDAPPDVVFDAFVDPATQERLHGGGRPDWIVLRNETDVRVGGTSVYAMGPPGQEPDVETRVFTVVERPHRLEMRHTMDVAEWGRAIETTVTITFEERDGATLFTMIQTGFEDAETRDDFQSGWPAYLDTLRGVVGDGLKARHDADEAAQIAEGGQA